MYYSGFFNKIVLANLSAIHWPNGKIPPSNEPICGINSEDPLCNQNSEHPIEIIIQNYTNF